jgi:hypothetical protein
MGRASGVTWWQLARLTWTGWEARREHAALGARAAAVWGRLARVADPGQRAVLLHELAAHRWGQALLVPAGWGPIGSEQPDRWRAVLAGLLADVESAVAMPGRGRRDVGTVLEPVAGPVLDRMAATPDLAERVTYLRHLYTAAADITGTDPAADTVLALPYPRPDEWTLSA